ncbi:helix-turn-helix transcriptional regulator [Actinoplanes sp. NPDC051633]|uniref:response regulator transcription factor n=1 Tax=Actinoplanes sp. NPDC051633 TaxID=3155670 RepID=UPI003414334F
MITERDLHTMLGIVAGADDRNADDALPHSILAALQQLIPCENVTFALLDSSCQVTDFEQEVGELGLKGDALEAWSAAFWSLYWESPVCCYPELTGDLTTIRTISDFHSDRELHATPIFSECFRLEGVERALFLCLPSQPGRTLRVMFFRGRGSDFSDRDRGLLALLRPHLYEAYQRQCRRQRTTPVLTTRERQVLQLVAAGHTNRQIGRRLSITEATVRKHLEHIFERLQVTSRTSAVTRVLGP